MGLLEHQNMDIGNESINTMQTYSVLIGQILLEKIRTRTEEKQKVLQQTSAEIKDAAEKLITEIKNQRDELLNELWAKCSREVSQLEGCHQELKKKLGEVASLYNDVTMKVTTGDQPHTTHHHNPAQKQAEQEIKILSLEGKSVLQSTNKTIAFQRTKNVFQIGNLTEKGEEVECEGLKPPVLRRQRSRTVTDTAGVDVKELRLRKACSTNDLPLTHHMTLFFQMSNDDLLAEDKHIYSQLLPQVSFVIDRTGSGLGEIQGPRDVDFLPDGNLLVTEHDNNRLQVFDIHSGKAIKLLQSGNVTPCGVTLTNHGYVVVADQANNTIKALTRSGQLVCEFGKGYFHDISFLTAKSDDNYIVIDNMGAWQQTVISYDAMTGVKTRIGYNSQGSYVINHPEYVCTDKAGNVAVSDGGNHCVWVFDNVGKLKFKFGQQGEGPGELLYPKGVAIGVQGHFIVADCGNHRVCEFDRHGHFLHCLLGKKQGLSYPQTVQVNDCYLVVVQASEVIVCHM